MNIINIDSSENVFFPLEKKLFDDPDVIYHGTGSGFISKIEKDGWKINDLPYDVDDFVKVEKYYDEIGFRGFSNRGWANFSFVHTNGTIHRNTLPSFTSNYWTARNYSANTMGEAIRNLIIAIDDYILFATMKEEQDKLKKKLLEMEPQKFCSEFLYENKEYQHGLTNFMLRYRIPHEDLCVEYFKKVKKQKLEKMLNRLNDSEYLSSNVSEFIKIKNKYKKYLNSYPVVYVVKTNKHNEDLSSPMNKELGINIPVHFDILPKEILTRIDFPNGIDRFMPFGNTPFVCEWNIQEINEYVSADRDGFLNRWDDKKCGEQFLQNFLSKNSPYSSNS